MNIQYFDNFSGGLRIFIKGIAVSAETVVCQIEAAKKLRKPLTQKICSCGKACDILMYLYGYVEKNLFVSVNIVSGELEILYNTVAKYIKTLCGLGIFLKNSGQYCYRIFAFDSLIRIFQYEIS